MIILKKNPQLQVKRMITQPTISIYLEAEGIQDCLICSSGHIEVQCCETQALQPHHHPEQLLALPLYSNLEVYMAFDHRDLNVSRNFCTAVVMVVYCREAR